MAAEDFMPPQDKEPYQESWDDVQELNSNIATLVDAIEKLTVKLHQTTKDRSKMMRPKLQQNSDNKENSMERNTVRLDGIEVYAVVSALTVASSIACLDTYGASAKSDTYMDKLLDICFTISNSIGILSGLHATLIFSLVTMYGRTAVGLGRDLAFSSFFGKTGIQRYRGFQTFLWSLYTFMVQVTIVIIKVMFPFGSFVRTIVLLCFVIVMYLISSDTNAIVEEASVIFDAKYGHNMSFRSLDKLGVYLKTSFRDQQLSSGEARRGSLSPQISFRDNVSFGETRRDSISSSTSRRDSVETWNPIKEE